MEVYFCGCYFCLLFKKKEEEKRKLYVFFSLNVCNRIEMNYIWIIILRINEMRWIDGISGWVVGWNKWMKGLLDGWMKILNEWMDGYK